MEGFFILIIMKNKTLTANAKVELMKIAFELERAEKTKPELSSVKDTYTNLLNHVLFS